MPHELEYAVKGALMLCDKGTAPSTFQPTHGEGVSFSGVETANTLDKVPNQHILPFGACSVQNGKPCTPLLLEWEKTYGVQINGGKTLLFSSCIRCSTGGKIEFLTSGQVPLPPEELDALLGEHGEKEDDGGWGMWDFAELIPVVGNVIGMVREAKKGNWGMFALNVGFLVLDVFTLGSASLITAPLKGGIKAGIKVAAKTAAKKVAQTTAKALTKGGIKGLAKGSAKAFAKGIAKAVDNIAIKNAKICVFACFPKGTLIHTKNGTTTIENIKVGDLVWSYNEQTGKKALKQVTATMQREVDATLNIELEGETIETTAEHPFYTKDQWKEATDLKTTDHLKTKQDNWQQIKGSNFAYQKKKVFNFEVADWHTYFVGKLGALVHNALKCITKAIKKLSNRLRYMGRTPGKKSRTGREVWDRMFNEIPPSAMIENGKKIFKASDGEWYPLKFADMSHIEDAVKWWNRKGHKFGAKAKEVRDWMLKSKNYRLDHRSINRSAGGKLKETYKQIP